MELIRKLSIYSLASILLVLQWSSGHASPGEMLKEFDLSVHSFIADPIRNYIYISDTATNSVAILETDQQIIVDSIFVGSAPRNMAITPDGEMLLVATAATSGIAVIDLTTQSFIGRIPLDGPVQSIAIDREGRIYAVPISNSFADMWIYDPVSEQVTDFSGCGSSCYSPLLQMSPDGLYLYVANRGLSPGTLSKFDVSGALPVLVWKNDHGDLGSNGQDLWVSQTGEHVYYAVGGGNRVAYGYDIAQLETTGMTVLGAFATGHYPREIVTSVDGDTAYAVHRSGHIDVWNADTFLQVTEYPTVGEAYELFVDRSGQLLLAAFQDKLRIYEAGGNNPTVDADGDGIADVGDNCLGLSNPGQGDTDQDGIGNECDPFPNNANHDFAECQLELEDVQSDLNQCRSTLTGLDSDLDGEIDSNDWCPDTPPGEIVDDSGCSIAQFCAKQNYKKKHCRWSDWQNDEPARKPHDCAAWPIGKKNFLCLPY